MMTTPPADIADLFSKKLDHDRSRTGYHINSLATLSKQRSNRKTNILNGVALLTCVGVAIYYMKKMPLLIDHKKSLNKMKAAA
jgi:hypothetical protein